MYFIVNTSYKIKMSDILLETGTGEVEILEFIVNKQYYAINVLKVKGIIQLEKIVPIPQASEEIMGITNIRGSMNIVIDLQKVLHDKKTENVSDKLGLLCEFNGTIVVFLVDKVKGILKVIWEEIEQTTQANQDVLMIGSILREDRIIILLDFEVITMNAQLGQGDGKQSELIGRSSKKQKEAKLVLVEDSRAIREMLRCSLQEVGYVNVKALANGKEAYDYILSLKDKLGKAFTDEIDLLITDIEMPMLDGYTLTRKIKEDETLNVLPVIIFSSLISKELMHKGEAVGADMQISKPSVKELVEVVDKMMNG